MAYTMEQLYKSGIIFNPVCGDGQGRAFSGKNQERLSAAMQANKLADLRFVFAEDIAANGWKLAERAMAVDVWVKDAGSRQWGQAKVFNAAEVAGIPSLGEMLEGARSRLPAVERPAMEKPATEIATVEDTLVGSHAAVDG